MKATELISNLTELIKIFGDLELCTSSDDEGNSFKSINFTPTTGTLNEEEESFEETTPEADRPTHICVN